MEYKSLVHENSWEAEQLRRTAELRQAERAWFDVLSRFHPIWIDYLVVEAYRCQFELANERIAEWWGDHVEERYRAA